MNLFDRPPPAPLEKLQETADQAVPQMHRLEPKQKYDCFKCGVGSANDQVVICTRVYCSDCAEDLSFDEMEQNGLRCSVCGLPQLFAVGGATCRNGHGGADGVSPSILPTQLAPVVVPRASVGLRRVSHSELAAFRLCQRLHYYSYRLRREPRVAATPLLVGRRVETIIKQIWRGESPSLDDLPPEERALCKAYPIWWRYHSLRVKSTDIPFQVEIGGIVFIGELDGDGEDNGEEVVVELKTTSEDIGVGAGYWRRVAQVDPQVTTYILVSRAQGRKVRRVVYDVIRKTTLERAMATPIDKRKYTKATKTEPARLYANQRDTDETDDEFELRVLENIAENPERYFQRRDIVRYEDEHKAHLRDVMGTVRLMQVVEEMPEAPRNVDACFKWGRVCPFLPVCLGEDRIDNNFLYQDRVRPKRKWGLWGVPHDPDLVSAWAEKDQGVVLSFDSYEEAEFQARLQVSADEDARRAGYLVLTKRWEARELPKKTETE